MSRTWKSRLAALAVVTAAAGVALASPAYAAALTGVAWSVSNPHPGSTGVRYTWSFTTGSGTNLITAVTLTVPTGTTVPAANVPSVVDNYGIGVGTALFDGTNTVTYTVGGGGSSLPSGTPVLISMDGFTNTSTANSYTSVVNTSFDSGTSPAVGINDNTTAVTVVVARSTAFTSDTTSFSLLTDPSVAALKDVTHDVTLTVSTNANSGYTLQTKVNQLLTGFVRGRTITAASNGMATGVASGSFATNTFGYKMVKSGGVGTLQSAPLLSGDYIGYTTGGENTFAATAPTNLDTVVLTNRAKVDYTLSADRYLGTITYTVTPTY